MDDPKTCLSPDPHDDIKDPILHYLGCVDISTRDEFLDLQSEVQSDEEIVPAANGVQPEGNQQGTVKKQEAWRADCQSELRRIDFLRSKLQNDKQEKHLVERIEESRKAWEASVEYEKGIRQIREWRKSSKVTVKKGGKPKPSDPENNYKPGLDVNTPFMLFKQRRTGLAYEGDDEKVNPTQAIWGKFPNQKTNVQRLLFDEGTNLLDSSGDDARIRYFHIPSNNMLWAEQAVSRYYGEARPKFHPPQRGIHAVKTSKAAWILKESHWRGQLHGGRATVSSRYMRPFCESIRSFEDDDMQEDDDTREIDDTQGSGAEAVAQNIVLFMPYMHWETSRNQQRFSRIIENIIDTRRKEERQEQEGARKARQLIRKSLDKPGRPTPTISHSFWDMIRHKYRVFKTESSQNLSRKATPNMNDEKQPQLYLGPIRSLTDMLRAQAVKEQLKLSGRYPQVDRHGRVDLDSWLEEQRRSQKQRSWLGRSKEEAPEPRYKLGQYLLDAARLFEGMTSYRDRKLLETYLMEDPPMHPRRTLDQAYYWSINNTTHRDLDQVVFRATTADPLKFHRWNVDRSIWTGHSHEENKTAEELRNHEHEPCPECTSNIQKVSRVIMVDQLWMWVLDQKTIITCFPKRYGANKHDTSGIHKSIRMRIDEGGTRIHSVFDLALVIFEECSNTFFDRTRTMDKQPRVLDEFSEAIGNIMHQQTDAFERLWRWTERASKIYRRLPGAGGLSQLHIPLLDINPEGKLEKEIKDIIEELGIMIFIKKSEKEVLECFVGHARQILDPGNASATPKGPGTKSACQPEEPLVHPGEIDSQTGTSSTKTESESPHEPKGAEEVRAAEAKARAAKAAFDWFGNNADELLKRVNQRIEQLGELERSAKSTAGMVKDLLDLKQQQAGVVQAWQSVEYSNEAMRQGRSIMVFTIVTIVFLPLSFMSSVFGMNAIEFGGSDNVMHLRDQFTYIFAISAGVTVMALFLSFSTSLRTFLWCIFKQSYTTVLVWTGVYRHIYLKINLTTDDMYENAVKKTENLKAKEKEKFLTFRRESREKRDKDKKSQTTADTQDDVSTNKAGPSTGWAHSLFRLRSVHGNANGSQNPSGAQGTSNV